MDADRLFTVVVGVVLLAGIGMSATTLQSSIETTPDQAIDVDAASLPIGSDDIGRYEGHLDDSGSGTGPGGNSDDNQATGSAGSGSEEPDSASGSDQSQADRRGAGQERASYLDEQSLLEWLLSLLRALLAFLLRILPLLVLFGLLALAVAARDRIATVLSRFVDEDDDGDGDTGPGLQPAPTNDVAQAWYEMAALVDADLSETASPRQCATRAVDAGADQSAVERVTRAFEEVRYGHAAVTPERRQQARDGLDDVRSQLGVDR